MALTDAAIRRAETRALKRRVAGAWAMSASYVADRRRVEVRLDEGVTLSLDPDHIEGLQGATDDALSEIVVSPAGAGLYFPRLDADIHIPSLLAGKAGSRAWTAAQMGRAGGRIRTAAKSDAARANGAKGGRPRKAQAADASVLEDA